MGSRKYHIWALIFMIRTALTLTLQKSEARKGQGIKGEVVGHLLRTLDKMIHKFFIIFLGMVLSSAKVQFGG